MKRRKSSLTTELSKLETFSPHILEASLRGMNLDEIFRDFYRANSPRFEGFRELCRVISEDVSSKSFDLQMTIVHNDFMAAMMNIISHQLEEIGVSEESFVFACQGSTNPVPMKLLQFLESQANFITFGENMEDKFHQLYKEQVESLAKQHVRVLWDIENINVPRKKGGAIETITKLQTFLQSKSLFGKGIDCRITAFFAPNNSSIPPKVIEELDKAAVELVWVSGKREDADRKLGFRISQEIQVLPPPQTVFVIISSDQDYRHHFQLLRNSGYSVIVIHDAKTDQWINVMELHSTEAYRWAEIIHPQTKQKISRQKLPLAPTSSGDDESDDHGKSKQEVSDVSSHLNEVIPCDATLIGNEERGEESDWLIGVCLNWKTSYGFCQVVAGAAEYLKKDIFIHKSILPKECHGNLSKGDQVNMKVMLKDKGLQATHLSLPPTRTPSPPPLSCESLTSMREDSV